MSRRILTLLTLVAALTLAGCPQGGEEPASPLPAADDSFPQEAPAAPDVGSDEDAERHARVAAWMEADLDQDGLPNDIELEFGLDPEDPTDGLDIDGDGTPNYRDDDVDGDGFLNETDPDVDGDGLFNLIDVDIDGDAVPDEFDFDIDADGIRNCWDWDDDSDGEDDEGYAFDEDDDLGQLEDEDLRFSAAVAALVRKAGSSVATEKYREQARKDLREMLEQVTKEGDGRRPVKPDGKEVELITEGLARRFHPDENHKTLAFELKNTVSQLLPRGFETPDAIDAVDAVFRQTMEVKNPRRPNADEELQTRLDAMQTLKSRFRQSDIPACSDAVSALAKMPGDGTLSDKVEGVLRLAEAVTRPDRPGGAPIDKLTELISDLGMLVERLEHDHDMDWGWDVMIDVLEGAPGIENGIGPEQLDYAEEEIAEIEGEGG